MNPDDEQDDDDDMPPDYYLAPGEEVLKPKRTRARAGNVGFVAAMATAAHFTRCAHPRPKKGKRRGYV